MSYSYSKMISAVAMTAMVLFGSLAVADDAKQPVGTVLHSKELASSLRSRDLTMSIQPC